jgi:hypothetical protein
MLAYSPLRGFVTLLTEAGGGLSPEGGAAVFDTYGEEPQTGAYRQRESVA